MPFKKNLKTLAVISGASKGFGQSLALTLAVNVGADSHFVLISRDVDGLQTTKDKLSVTATIRVLDLAQASKQELVQIFEGLPDSNYFPQLIIIHNAGTLGDVKKTCNNLDDPTEVSCYYGLNLSAAAGLNAAFMKYAAGCKNIVVVHITSLMALQPAKYMSLYCSGKAARDMFFKVFAIENPDVQVLGWSPGPLDGTDMSVKVRTENGDAETRQMFENMYADNKYVECQDSANKMLDVLIQANFESGSHVDFYD